jgi:hypothetical protein
MVAAASCLVLSGVMVPALAATPAASPAAVSANRDLAARIQRIEDHIAIERLLMEYGRTLDRRDFDAYSQLFAKSGSWSGSLGTFTGPAEIKAAMLKAFAGAGMAHIGSNFHVMTNPIIEIEGDTASASSKWTFMRMVENKPVIALSGSYEDKLVREGGVWKFQSRVASTPPSGAKP